MLSERLPEKEEPYRKEEPKGQKEEEKPELYSSSFPRGGTKRLSVQESM